MCRVYVCCYEVNIEIVTIRDVNDAKMTLVTDHSSWRVLKKWLVTRHWSWRPASKKARHSSTRHDNFLKTSSSLVNSSWRLVRNKLVTSQLVSSSTRHLTSWRVTSQWLVIICNTFSVLLLLFNLYYYLSLEAGKGWNSTQLFCSSYLNGLITYC